MMELLTVHLPWEGGIVFWPGIVLLGLIVGFVSGLLGVGGGFLITPALFVFFGVPYPYAVGSTLAQMVFVSFTGVMRHWKTGNIELRLVLSLMAGAVIGVECGAVTIQKLKLTGEFSAFGRVWNLLDFTLSVIYIFLLVGIGMMMLNESRSALRRPPRGGVVSTCMSRWLQSRRWAPMMSLPHSGIKALPFWAVAVMGFAGGYCSGLLGVGGGFLLVPAMIFGLGVPTSIATGTGLSQTMFTAMAGTFTHVMKNNVDWMLAGLILLGSVAGVQPGVWLTLKIRGAYVRLAFAFVTLASALGIALKLVFF